MLDGRHIVLGVSGGIAAYKCAQLTRDLVRAGAEVQVVMTPSAAKFVTPLTLATLSRRSVLTEMFPAQSDHWTKHIELGRWADVMMIAPATANTIAKLAHGHADNFLTTLALAMRARLVLAPSMDMDMFLHPATQANLALLRERGAHIIEPEEGELASGLRGPGRLPEPAALLVTLDRLFSAGDLSGIHVLVTAGPTHEPIDPVRFLANASSGKMGFALAAVAAGRGAQVTLVTGPVQLETPRGVRRIDVVTGAEMHEMVAQEFPSARVLVAAAAVADFTPAVRSSAKIKRDETDGDTITLSLVRNPDILAGAGSRKRGDQVLVGFALETEAGEANARKKLVAKRLDLIVLNSIADEGAGFGVDTNVVTMFGADGSVERLPKLPKTDVAQRIFDRVARLLVSPTGK
jgi:phosphopantothenoylcysteine decarboxylase/phosphopantothenate--cysteine ligase